ncbi:hypothetical protein [Winogradskyella helgolandensis]|uniref:hypothetical protein n=1 Tax=Winogradskyella helgolandensis TaxID=2697010 RepID=UPI0015C8100B|nr:hypothetical protein [Winogradskyella helgolandensis]
MKLRNLFLLLMMIMCYNLMNAQKVKLKKEFVYIDDVKVFKYEKNAGEGWLTLFDLDNDDEIIFIRENDNGTDYRDDDYTQYKFLKEDIIIEISTYNYWKNHVKFLYKNKCFDLDGKVDQKKVQNTFDKFDEKITVRTIKN